MAESELLDIVDENGQVIGQATRSECHHNPKLIHPVVHCWLFNPQGQILWQQRSLQKVLSPGRQDMSCGGHVLSNYSPDETITRELLEELGVQEANPIFVQKYIDGDENQTELIYLYYAVLSIPESEFVLQDEEVERIEWIDVNKAMIMAVSGERDSTHWIFDQIPRIYNKIFKDKFRSNNNKCDFN